MIGIFSKTVDSNAIEALGFSGLDFVILDQEHGAVTTEKLFDHIRAAKASGMTPVVRVKGNDHHAIGSALDAGAQGIQVPNINSKEEAQRAIAAARFAPIGNRGVCRFVQAADFGHKDRKEYFSKANEKLLVLQVEGQEGINNLDSILRLEGFDILFVGPYDLSQSIGIPGEIDHPKMDEVIDKVIQMAKDANKQLGIFTDTIGKARHYRKLGVHYIAYSVDLHILQEAMRGIIKEINS